MPYCDSITTIYTSLYSTVILMSRKISRTVSFICKNNQIPKTVGLFKGQIQKCSENKIIIVTIHCKTRNLKG